MNKIVGVYARVSKIDQHPENQIHELERYVQSRGWTMFNGKPFVDHGISGAKGADKRPALRALMEAAHKRKIQAVLVWEFSRFARSLHQLSDAMDKFRQWQIDFVSIQQNVDTTTASGRMMFGLFALIAEYERELIRERTLLGLLEARANGKRLGRPSCNLDLDLVRKNLKMSVRTLADLLNVSPATAARLKIKYGGVSKTPLKNTPMIVGGQA